MRSGTTICGGVLLGLALALSLPGVDVSACDGASCQSSTRALEVSEAPSCQAGPDDDLGRTRARLQQLSIQLEAAARSTETNGTPLNPNGYNYRQQRPEDVERLLRQIEFEYRRHHD